MELNIQAFTTTKHLWLKVVDKLITCSLQNAKSVSLCVFFRWTRRLWRGWSSSTLTLCSVRLCRTAREPWRELTKWAGAPAPRTLRSYRLISLTDTRKRAHTKTQFFRHPCSVCRSVMFAPNLLFKHACGHVATHSEDKSPVHLPHLILNLFFFKV